MTFLFLGAVRDKPTAILYSLNALTAFGHMDIKLERKWQLIGAMESLNGWILFGLSTAYLFALIQMIVAIPEEHGYQRILNSKSSSDKCLARLSQYLQAFADYKQLGTR